MTVFKLNVCMPPTRSIQGRNAHRSKKSRLSKPCKFLHGGNLANHFQAFKVLLYVQCTSFDV